MRRYIGEIGLIMTAIIWGSGFVASAVSLEYYTPYQILTGRFLIGAIFLGIIFYKKLPNLNKGILIKGSILGFILYIAFALQTVGLQFTTPSKNAFLTAINVVIVPFIGWIFYKRRINLYEFIGALVAISGVAVLSLNLSFEINIGDFLTLCCAVAFAFHIFYTMMFVKNEDPALITLVQMATASITAWIVVLFRGESTFSMEIDGLVPLVYLALFSTAIAFLLQTTAQKFISETKAAIILSTESLWGMVFSIIILSEIITVRMGIGAALILGAIVISETKLRFLTKNNPVL